MYNYVVLQVDNLIAKSLFKCFQKELDKVLPAKRMQPSIPRIYLYWRAFFLSPWTHPHHVLLDYVTELNKSECQKRVRLCD